GIAWCCSPAPRAASDARLRAARQPKAPRSRRSGSTPRRSARCATSWNGTDTAPRCTADVSDASALTAAVDELAVTMGPFHVVHANAGILAPAATITELDLDVWNR